MPVQAAPAPTKTMRCSAIRCFVMRSAARIPPTATLAVPWMSSLNERYAAGTARAHRRLRAEGYRIESVVNHASAIGCYFFDPEGNRTEVFWVTGRPSWVPVANPIDIEQPDEVVLAEVDRLWEQVRHVPVGGTMADEPAALQIGP